MWVCTRGWGSPGPHLQGSDRRSSVTASASRATAPGAAVAAAAGAGRARARRGPAPAAPVPPWWRRRPRGPGRCARPSWCPRSSRWTSTISRAPRRPPAWLGCCGPRLGAPVRGVGIPSPGDRGGMRCTYPRVQTAAGQLGATAARQVREAGRRGRGNNSAGPPHSPSCPAWGAFGSLGLGALDFGPASAGGRTARLARTVGVGPAAPARTSGVPGGPPDPAPQVSCRARGKARWGDRVPPPPFSCSPSLPLQARPLLAPAPSSLLSPLYTHHEAPRTCPNPSHQPACTPAGTHARMHQRTHTPHRPACDAMRAGPRGTPLWPPAAQRPGPGGGS